MRNSTTPRTNMPEPLIDSHCDRCNAPLRTTRSFLAAVTAGEVPAGNLCDDCYAKARPWAKPR